MGHRKKNSISGQWIVVLSALLITVLSVILIKQLYGVFNKDSYKIIPEYDRFLGKVVFSLPVKNEKVPSLTLINHLKLLEFLPEYTEVLVILPENRIEEVRLQIDSMSIKNKVLMCPFKTYSLKNGYLYMVFSEKDKLVGSGLMKDILIPKGTIWAQDLFEVAVNSKNQNQILISEIYKMLYSTESKSNDQEVNVNPDNLYLDNLLPKEIKTKRTPLAFMGGNLLVDKFNGKTIAFIGWDVFKDSKILWQAYFEKDLDYTNFKKMLKKFLNVDELYMIGSKKPQPSYMFHLDQTMIFLGDGVVGVTNLVGDAPAEYKKEVEYTHAFLLETRTLLRQLGYRIISIDTSIQNLLKYRFPTNSIPYIDKISGEKKLLIPIQMGKIPTDEKVIIEKNSIAFNKAGYEVIQVPTEASNFNGGIHCLINVIE